VARGGQAGHAPPRIALRQRGVWQRHVSTTPTVRWGRMSGGGSAGGGPHRRSPRRPIRGLDALTVCARTAPRLWRKGSQHTSTSIATARCSTWPAGPRRWAMTSSARPKRHEPHRHARGEFLRRSLHDCAAGSQEGTAVPWEGPPRPRPPPAGPTCCTTPPHARDAAPSACPHTDHGSHGPAPPAPRAQGAADLLWVQAVGGAVGEGG